MNEAMTKVAKVAGVLIGLLLIVAGVVLIVALVVGLLAFIGWAL